MSSGLFAVGAVGEPRIILVPGSDARILRGNLGYDARNGARHREVERIVGAPSVYSLK